MEILLEYICITTFFSNFFGMLLIELIGFDVCACSRWGNFVGWRLGPLRMVLLVFFVRAWVVGGGRWE